MVAFASKMLQLNKQQGMPGHETWHYNKDAHSLSCLGTGTIIKMPAHFPVLVQVL
jgi:hypothetical protein